MTQKKEISLEDYIQALERMKKSPRDRVGIIGDLAATGIGSIAGVGAAGTVAGVAGATTILGSSTLASVVGGVFVASTPVGWIAGLMVLGGAFGYGATRLIRGGQKQDIIKKQNMLQLQARIKELQIHSYRSTDKNEKMEKSCEFSILA